jgi:hypothetical protein
VNSIVRQAAHSILPSGHTLPDEIAFVVANSVVIAIPRDHVLPGGELRLRDEVPHAIAGRVFNHESYITRSIKREANRD